MDNFTLGPYGLSELSVSCPCGECTHLITPYCTMLQLAFTGQLSIICLHFTLYTGPDRHIRMTTFTHKVITYHKGLGLNYSYLFGKYVCYL